MSQVSLKDLDVNTGATELIASYKAKAEASAKKEEENKDASKNFKFKPEILNKKKTQYKIRILPNIHKDGGKSEPWLTTYSHIIRQPDGIKRSVICPTSYAGTDKLNAALKTNPCPICEAANVLFKKVNEKTASKAEEDKARDLYRKPRFHFNVLVLEDPRPAATSQKGQVLIWEAGKKIFTNIQSNLVDRGMIFYSPKTGHNLNIIVTESGGYPNYDLSYFDNAASPITTSDSELDEISGQIRDLAKFALGKGPRTQEQLVAFLNGEQPKNESKEWDSHRQAATSRPSLDEHFELNDNDVTPKVAPATPKAAISSANTSSKTVAAKPIGDTNDDDLMAALDAISDT